MAKDSNITWCDHTWNAWTGCKKVSSGCKYCYMFRGKHRWGQDGSIVTRAAANTFNLPYKLDAGLIFTNSYSDVFLQEADEWRDEFWKVIRENPQHTFLILTKRIERALACLPDDWLGGYPNVSIGVSIENNDVLHERLNHLSYIPAWCRFVSYEPLISPQINIWELANLLDEYSRHNEGRNLYDWCILGGESGNKTGKFRYRPAEIHWFKELINLHYGYDQTSEVSAHSIGKVKRENGYNNQDVIIPVWVKQFGQHIQDQFPDILSKSGECLKLSSKGKFVGMQGKDIINMLHVRDMPTAFINKHQHRVSLLNNVEYK